VTDEKASTPVRALVFDIGGVLIQLGNPTELFGLAGDTEHFLARWLHSPSVRDFERGAINAETFARRIVTEAALTYDWQEFLERFMAWPGLLFPGITELLEAIPNRYQRALMSNTNEAHWRDGGLAAQLDERFELRFLSFETGLLKPDVDAFRHLASALGHSPGEIAFFDDNIANVRSASSLGFQARLTRGATGLEAALVELGVLSTKAR
jgi:putative hydrolase of the HAD superfamily